MTRPLSVLVVRFGALGDVVLTTPLLRALRDAYPNAAITYVTKAEWAPLVTDQPGVRQVAVLEPRQPLRTLAARLRGTPWDHRLDLHGSTRSRLLRRLVGGRWHGWRKPRWRRGWRIWTGRPASSISPVPEQMFGAVRHLNIVPDGGPPSIAPNPEAMARARALVPQGPYVALAPGAAHATKRWPGPHWDRLATLLAARGLPAVVVGAAEDAGRVTASVRQACGIGLGPTAAVLGGAAVAVAGDTGLMHLATAVGTPVVALFGPTDPTLGYGPYRARAIVLGIPLACRPCSVYGGDHCPLRHHRCMIDLDPLEVANAVEQLLT